MKRIQFCRWISIAITLQSVLAGCSIFQPWFPSSGPSKGQIIEQQEGDLSIPVIDATGAVARRLQAAQERSLFSETLGDVAPVGHIVGPGDVLEVSV